MWFESARGSLERHESGCQGRLERHERGYAARSKLEGLLFMQGRLERHKGDRI